MLAFYSFLTKRFPAQTAGVEPALPADSTERLILDSQEVDLGPRSIIYNRVATPDLLPQQEPVKSPVAESIASVPTAEEIAAFERWQQMHHVTLFLSCTVYEDSLTEVHVWHEQSQISFWTTINFHYLSQITSLETEDTYYFLLMGLGDSTREEFDRNNAFLLDQGRPELVRVWPVLSPSSTSSKWEIVSGDPAPPEVIRAIEDLHNYFDANRNNLINQYTQREAERVARQAWQKANPPQPVDTVIEFFPIQSAAQAEPRSTSSK